MIKNIRNRLWFISYQVRDGKIIELLFSAKGGHLVGWSQRTLFLEGEGVS